jgi:hypothetical protein
MDEKPLVFHETFGSPLNFQRVFVAVINIVLDHIVITSL